MEFSRESVFVSALRTFCKMFFGLIALMLALFFGSIVYSAFVPPYEFEETITATILPDLEDQVELQPLHSPVILQIDITGVIGELFLDTGTLRDILVESQRGVLGHDRVKAILLHMNTPGGTVTDSDNIYRMIQAYKAKHKVPVFAYVDGMCASGGMYISSAADKMFASPASIVGSVGVIFGPFFNFTEGMAKIGIEAKTLTQGLNKDMMSSFRPWKPGEDAAIVATMQFFYNRFVDIVTAAHPRLDRGKLVNEYGANIFDGPAAQERGYIDVADSDYKQALLALMQEAKVNPQEPYQVLKLSRKMDVFSALGSPKSSLLNGQIEHTINWNGEKRSTAIRDQFAYLYEPGATQ